MFFGKMERKKRHPLRMLTVAALAITGAMTIASGAMEFVKEKAKCMASFFKGVREE